MTERDVLLARTFVEVADTLVDEFDVVDFLSGLATRCVELFNTVEAGLMVAEAPGAVQVVASSSHEMHLLELFEVQHDQGPCLDCYRTGEPIECPDLNVALDRWPTFAPEALAAGFSSVHALPMRLRSEVIGSLNLLVRPPGGLHPSDLTAAQALADVATISILQHRAAEEARLLAEQLQYALNSRVTIEQAKGVLSERSGLDADTAFAALRRHARNNNLRLVDVAEGIVNRTLDADAITPRKPARPDAPPPGAPPPSS
ncbi:MAG: ANTAR domain-containing protein [Acidimicrobiia bacterium]